MNPGPPPRKDNIVFVDEANKSIVVPHNSSISKKKLSGKIALTNEIEKQEFVKWCVEKRGSSPKTCRDRANYLMRQLDLKNSHSVKAYRLYYHYIGVEPPKELKVPRSGVKLDIPSTSEVIDTIEKACVYRQELCIIYRLLLESGARLEEVLEMLRNYDPKKDKHYNGFYTYELSYIRKTKRSFYIFHITPVTHRINLSKDWVSKQSRKLEIVRARQIRKYVSTRLAMLGVPESIIDFIQGRTPQSILAKHYLNLYALATREYPKFKRWLQENIHRGV